MCLKLFEPRKKNVKDTSEKERKDKVRISESEVLSARINTYMVRIIPTDAIMFSSHIGAECEILIFSYKMYFLVILLYNTYYNQINIYNNRKK